jgi:hypothetical protein
VKRRAFRIGDRVVIVRADKGCEQMIGEVATITSGLVRAEYQLDPIEDWPVGTLVHSLDIPTNKENWVIGYPPEYLELYRNDGNEKATWTRQLRKLCGRVEVKS